jgi:hypothetical protein
LELLTAVVNHLPDLHLLDLVLVYGLKASTSDVCQCHTGSMLYRIIYPSLYQMIIEDHLSVEPITPDVKIAAEITSELGGNL